MGLYFGGFGKIFLYFFVRYDFLWKQWGLLRYVSARLFPYLQRSLFGAGGCYHGNALNAAAG